MKNLATLIIFFLFLFIPILPCLADEDKGEFFAKLLKYEKDFLFIEKNYNKNLEPLKKLFSLSEINEVKDAESKIYSSLTYKVLDSSTDFNTSKTVYVSLPASSHQNMKEITYNFEILEERISDLYDNLKDTEKSAKEENISKDDLEELADLKAKARNLRGRIKTLENRLEELSIANDIEVPDAEADDNFYELSLDKITPFVRQNYVTPLK